MHDNRGAVLYPQLSTAAVTEPMAETIEAVHTLLQHVCILCASVLSLRPCVQDMSYLDQ